MTIKGNARILKSKEFWFVIIFYPCCLIAYLFTRMYLNMTVFKLEDTQRYFDVASAILAVTVVYTIYERIEKRFSYKVQGDKLKIKQSEKGWKK